MTDFIRRPLAHKGKKYYGFLCTEMEPEEFLYCVLRGFAQYSCADATLLVYGPEITEDSLLDDDDYVLGGEELAEYGFVFNDDPNNRGRSIILYLLGEGKWLVDGLTADEAEELAEAVDECPEPEDDEW